MTEFDLIKRFFKSSMPRRSDVILGIGDDCALLEVPIDHQLAISMDTLVEGVHFPKETHPGDIGYKALAVNLSDLAAMGAQPLWVTLALTIPHLDEHWLQAFCAGFFELANRYQVTLVGGDTTQGPLSITLQAHGMLPKGQALRRSGAHVGDGIYVTGTLGGAGWALAQINHHKTIDNTLLNYLNRPEPRVAAGLALRSLATSAIDISDGLLADLGHLVQQSEVGAHLWANKLPIPPHLSQLSPYQILELVLTAGDDYELCFTAPKHYEPALNAIFARLPYSYTCIGSIMPTGAIELLDENDQPILFTSQGFQHFRNGVFNKRTF